MVLRTQQDGYDWKTPPREGQRVVYIMKKPYMPNTGGGLREGQIAIVISVSPNQYRNENYIFIECQRITDGIIFTGMDGSRVRPAVLTECDGCRSSCKGDKKCEFYEGV